MDSKEELRLYLLEVQINKITFTPPYVHFPRKDKINVFVTFKNLISMHMQSDNCVAPSGEDEMWRRREVKLDFLKFQEFYYKPENLLLALNEDPLIIYFSANWKPWPLGKTMIAWPFGFLEWVEKSRWYNASKNPLPPVVGKGTYELFSHDGAQIGEVEVLLTLCSPISDSEVL